MNEKKIAFEQRLEQNSKNYSPKDLFHLEDAEEMLSQLKESFGLDTLMTDRHGSILMTKGILMVLNPMLSTSQETKSE